ncbi:hypothetical protein SY83_13405 [Paenibacillus swuensis]|uniref:ABC transporter substrate-binding protein n=1 Tax=Paenibacillus swuensis TaxID=1178515 RepID=A0A172TJE8_9BACL|nr:extracellular solute-binding protein [Paenibacillus swuensis]ANE47092.1 hypothetical protein SY83_13405 [Paenibacillus swuensis]
MNTKFKMRMTATALAMVLAVSGLAGCSSNSNGNGANGNKNTNSGTTPNEAATNKPAEPEGPLKIKAMSVLFGDAPAMPNPALEAVQKAGNVELDIEYVPSDVYNDKLNIAMTNNEYDLILWEKGKADEKFIKYAKQGAFHDVSEMVKGKNKLDEIPAATWNLTAVDGKNFGIPRPRASFGNGESNIIIRKDWLDQYGLPVPKTVDELTNALKVFKEKDPAGGGKTIPLSLYGSWAGNVTYDYVFGNTTPFRFAFGMPAEWRIEGDKAVHESQTPEYKKYLEFVKTMWADKLIDKDAAILKGDQATNKFQSGVVGAIANNVRMIGEPEIEKIQKNDPKAELAFIPVLTGPDGKAGTNLTSGYYGLWVIPSKVDKEKAERIVEFLNWSADGKVNGDLSLGIKGIHYSEVNVKDANAVPPIREVIQTDEQKEATKKDRPDHFIIQNPFSPYINNGRSLEVVKQQRAYFDEMNKKEWLIPNPFDGMSSETLAKNPDNRKKLDQAALRFVLGEVQWDGVQKEIDAWVKAYGETIGKEYLDQYNAAQK